MTYLHSDIEYKFHHRRRGILWIRRKHGWGISNSEIIFQFLSHREFEFEIQFGSMLKPTSAQDIWHLKSEGLKTRAYLAANVFSDLDKNDFKQVMCFLLSSLHIWLNFILKSHLRTLCCIHIAVIISKVLAFWMERNTCLFLSTATIFPVIFVLDKFPDIVKRSKLNIKNLVRIFLAP